MTKKKPSVTIAEPTAPPEEAAPETLSLAQHVLGRIPNFATEMNKVMVMLNGLDKQLKELANQNRDLLKQLEDQQVGYSAGFEAGTRHIVTMAEENMAREFGGLPRNDLVESGKLPSWWITTLVKDFVRWQKAGKPTAEALAPPQRSDDEALPGDAP